MSRFIEYLGRPANLVGSATTVLLVTGTLFLEVNPIIPVVAGAAGYIGGFLVASPSKHLIALTPADENSERHIEENIKKLEQQINQHRNALPDSVAEGVDNILVTLKDILPHWKTMDSFVEQKFTMDSIVTDYLPTTLNAYLALPKSYLARTKKDAEGNILKQLNILQGSLNEIQDNVYTGVEKEIENQSRFLESKFVNKDKSIKLA